MGTLAQNSQLSSVVTGWRQRVRELQAKHPDKLDSLFGQPIYAYTRKNAIDDGTLVAAYPEAGEAIHAMMSPVGEDWLNRAKDQCVVETALTFGFHHLSEYFNEDPTQAMSKALSRKA